MRRPGRLLLHTLILAAALVGCNSRDKPASSSTTTTTLPAPATQRTQVRGTIPDLIGRWLVLGQIKLPNGTARTTAAMWEITPGDGQPSLTMRFVELPDAQKHALDERNQKGEAWTLTPADVAAVATAWDALPVESAFAVAQVATELVGSDAFDDAFKADATSQDAQWVVRQTLTMQRSAAPVIRSVYVYAALGEKDAVTTGNFITSTIAAAPFPIPITFQGTFEMHRVPVVVPSLWQRLRRFLHSRS